MRMAKTEGSGRWVAAAARRAWRCALLACALLAASSPARAIDPSLVLEQLHHRSWRGGEGAPTAIFALSQTTEGFLWAGTATGLFRFDGQRFERVESLAGERLRSRQVMSLMSLPDGGLAIGYQGGGVSVFRGGRLQHFTVEQGVPSGSVWRLETDADGDLWAATVAGVARLRQDRWESVDITCPRTAGPDSLVVDREGSVWVSTTCGIRRMRRGGRSFEAMESAFNRPMIALAPDGSLWGASDEPPRVGPLQGDGKSLDLNAPMASRIRFDAQGTLWVLSDDRVLRWSQPLLALQAGAGDETRKPQAFGLVQGLSGSGASSLFEDREGSVWVGTGSGLDRFRAGRITPMPMPLKSAANVAVLPGEGGRLWVTSTQTGLVEITPSADGAPMALRNVARPETVFSHLHRDRDGIVWAGEGDTLWNVDARGARPVLRLPPQPLLHDTVQAIGKAPDGSLWVSRVRGLYRHADGQWTALPALGGWETSTAMVIAEDGQGLWFGFSGNRLARLRGGELKRFTAEDGLQVGTVRCVHPVLGRHVWVAGSDGLAILQDGRIRMLATEDDTTLTGLSGLVETRDGDLWLAGATGISRIPAAEWRRALAEPDHLMAIERLDFLDGLPSLPHQLRPLPALALANDGKLWLALTGGLAYLEPANWQLNRAAPTVQIRTVTANGVRHTPQGPALALPVGTTDLRIDFAAAALRIPERVQFRYRLEGYDARWQEGGARRDAAYTHLSPGPYRFRVRAANEDGVWGEREAVLSIDVPPAFWQTRWFVLLCAAGMLAAIVLLYRWRIARLSAVVRRQAEARLDERERIARELHDTLLQGVTGLSLQVQAAAMTSEPGSEIRTRLERALAQADQLIVEGRDRVTALRGASSDAAPLGVWLAAACDELNEAHPGTVAEVSIEGEADALAPDVREELRWVGREAISNAFRHAQAKRIEVILRREKDRFQLIVRDDGKGLDKPDPALAERPGHHGLKGMRERVRTLGGKLDIKSRPGSTEVTVTLVSARAVRGGGAWRGRRRTDA